MVDLEVPVQRIRAFVRDHMLEPDAMRGSEHYLRNITDGEGNAITPVDEEESRRQFAAEAVQTRAPIRVSSPQSQTSASETTPPAVPVSEAPGRSPNIQGAPIVATPSTPPVVTDPGVDWQAKARAEGWAPRGDVTEREYRAPSGPPVDPKYQEPYMAPATTTPVPNAEPGAPVPETSAPPAPASGEGSVPSV